MPVVDEALLARDVLIGGDLLRPAPTATRPWPRASSGRQRGILDHREQRARRDLVALLDRDLRDAPGDRRADDRVELRRRRDHAGDVDRLGESVADSTGLHVTAAGAGLSSSSSSPRGAVTREQREHSSTLLRMDILSDRDREVGVCAPQPPRVHR